MKTRTLKERAPLQWAFLLVMAVAGILPHRAAAADGDVPQLTVYGVEPGFMGHPMLASHGYTAEVGAFNINIGTGALANLPNITDSDPDNYASMAGLASATLILDESIRVVPDPGCWTDASITRKPEAIAPGTEVGCVISSTNASVSVVQLQVLRFFTFYFYDKDGNVICHPGTSTPYAVQGENAGETSLVGLNVVSVGTESPSKVTCRIPEGMPKDAYGIGFGLAGVNAEVGEQIRVYYAFIDDFVTQPITLEYFPNATAEVYGMGSGARKLINNKLTDGAPFNIILNIRGAGFKVNAGTEIPAGAEIGFVVKSGTALDLSVGEVRDMYPINKDGSRQEAQKVQVVNAVGLQVAGGGDLKLGMITRQPCYGIDLDWITGLGVNLGGDKVLYAYVRLPEAVPPYNPFQVRMDVLPGNQASSHDTGKENSTRNYIGLYNPVGHTDGSPINVNGDYWSKHNVLSCSAAGFHHDWDRVMRFAISRSATRDDNGIHTELPDAEAYICTLQIFQVGKGAFGNNYSDNLRESGVHVTTGDYAWECYDKKGLMFDGKLSVDADGNLNLDDILFPVAKYDGWLQDHHEKTGYTYSFDEKPLEICYQLHFMGDTGMVPEADYAKYEEGAVVAIDGISTAQSKVVFEPAGYSLADIEQKESVALGTGYGPNETDLAPGYYKHNVLLLADSEYGEKQLPYLIRVWEITDADASKETPAKSYNGSDQRAPLYSYQRVAGADGNIDNWELHTGTQAGTIVTPLGVRNGSDAGSDLVAVCPMSVDGVTGTPGAYTPVRHTYYTELTCMVAPDYITYLQGRYSTAALARYTNNHNPVYVCPKATAPELELPTAAFKQRWTFRYNAGDTESFLRTVWEVQENGLSQWVCDGTPEALDIDERKESQWTAFEAVGDPASAPQRRAGALTNMVLSAFLDHAVRNNDKDDEDTSVPAPEPEEADYVGLDPRTRAYDSKSYTTEITASPGSDHYSYQAKTRLYVPLRSLYLDDMPVTYLTADADDQSIVVPDQILTDLLDLSAPAEEPVAYYDLAGRRVANPEPGAFYIARQGLKAAVVRF